MAWYLFSKFLVVEMDCLESKIAMNIRKTLLLLACACPVTSFGQNLSQISHTLKLSSPANTRDVVSKKPVSEYDYAVTYRYGINMNAFDTTSGYIVDYDLMRLEIGSNGLTRYYSISADRRDSIMYRARISTDNRNGVDLDSWMPEGRFALYEDTYLNWPETGKLTVRMGMVKEEFEYTEPIPQMTWQFLNIPPRTVCGYQCMAAGTTFRGRQYTVWFTPDIPISAGPWKFSGLPGLILAVDESSGIFSWEAVGISSDTGNIHLFDPEYDCITNHVSCGVPLMYIRRITRRQALDLERRRWADPFGMIVSSGINVRVTRVTANGEIVSDEKVSAANREKYVLPEIPALELE